MCTESLRNVNYSAINKNVFTVLYCLPCSAGTEQFAAQDDAYFINSLGKCSISIFHQSTACHQCQEKVWSPPKIGSVKSYHEEDKLHELRLLVSDRALLKLWISRMSPCWALISVKTLRKVPITSGTACAARNNWNRKKTLRKQRVKRLLLMHFDLIWTSDSKSQIMIMLNWQWQITQCSDFTWCAWEA